jgi:hypothetical protein
MRKLVVLLVLAAAVPLASAQAYKWRDANGRIQYSDTPPPAGAKDVQQLRKAPPPAASGAAAAPAKSVTEQDAEFRKRLVEKQEAEAKQAKAAEDEQVRARNCAQARGQLAALDSGGRMVQFNAQGERVALDDAERERARQDSLKAIDTWCKQGG